ncbi:MAG TPA: hypothetical protein VNO55_28385, partial [Polyangia bacterium]|nr:hypothetical protein [Polyangia bacterium]
LAQAETGFVVVLGLDQRPSVSVYAPQGQPSARLTLAGKTLLPEAVVADTTAGTERIVALSCAKAIAPDQARAVAARALAAAGGRPEKVGELPLPCRQASVLITKAPAP